MRACVVLSVGAATWLPSPVHAQAPSTNQTDLEFEKAKNAYVTKDYTEAEERFRAMLNSGAIKNPQQAQDAQMYFGASKLQRALRTSDADVITPQKRAELKDEAAKVIEKLILDNPDYVVDPFTFDTKVLDLYSDAKKRLKDILNQRAIEAAKAKAAQEQLEKDLKAQQEAYVKLLEDQASQTVERHSRWLALLPFGVGQYQNGKPVLGTIFLGFEAACIIGTGVTFAMYRLDIARGAEALAADSTSHDRLLQYQQYSDRAGNIRIVNLAFTGAAALAMVVGIIEAQINFVPDAATTKTRPLPAKPPLPKRSAWFTPTIAPLVTERNGQLDVGAQIGVAGTF